MSNQNSEAKVSYRHPSDLSGERFVQLASDSLPAWAVDVQEYISSEEVEVGNYLSEDVGG